VNPVFWAWEALLCSAQIQQTNSYVYRKYPQFQQDEIFGLQDAFRKLDVDDKGYIDEATAIKATQSSERQPYDVVRQALKEVELDSSRRVELDDYVGVSSSPISSSFCSSV
jgi:plastin-1